MSNELKPCPFCGGEAEYGANSVQGYEYVRCASCKARTWSCYETKEQAAQAWNTRAERTCEIVRCETGEPAEYDCDEVLWHCESCHEEVAIYAYNENGDTWADKPSFCPNCGSKVVSE